MFLSVRAFGDDEKKPEVASQPRVVIKVDVTDAPDLAEWAEKAKKLCETWHPIIGDLLGIKDPPVYREVTLRFGKMRGIAATTKNTVNISAEFVRQHPDDFGMVLHELTHVIQAYPTYDPVWLVEGIADYVRYWHCEPGEREFAITEKSNYTDSYGTTARFLAWVAVTKDSRIVRKLSQALRDGKYKEEMFRDATGKDLKELWREFATAVREK
ncbi:MAG: basic secretory protein-like protein [Pirellulaceae bacterium]